MCCQTERKNQFPPNFSVVLSPVCSWAHELQEHTVGSHSACPSQPSAPFLQSCSLPSQIPACPPGGLCQPTCRALHLPLLNFMRSPRAHFSSLTRSVWVAALPSSISATPPNFVSPTNVLRGHYPMILVIISAISRIQVDVTCYKESKSNILPQEGDFKFCFRSLHTLHCQVFFFSRYKNKK